MDVYSRNWTLEIAKFEKKIEEKPEKTTLEEKYIDGDRKGERGRERERERGADVYNDKDVLVNSQRLSAKTTTTDVSFLLFNSVRID